jgi:steroid 5-alpha reductase family enzyme
MAQTPTPTPSLNIGLSFVGPRIFLLVTLLFSVSQASSFVTPKKMLNIPRPKHTNIHQVQDHLDSATFLQTSSSKNNKYLWIRGGAAAAAQGTTKLHLSPTSFDNGPFWQYNQLMVLANGLGFIISLISGGSHVHLDLIGTGAFAISALPTLFSSGAGIPRIQLSSACVGLWATKLASFLFFRATKIGNDKRLEDTLSTVSGTFAFWTGSFVWGILCSLPHSLGTTSNLNVPITESPCGIAGISLFVVGFLTESLADYQKWNFKKTYPGQFCNVGLWSISQHPNFVGNILLWSGIFLLNAPALIDPAPAAGGDSATIFQTLWRFKRLALAALSPLILYKWFSVQIDGSATNTQELAMKKYGSDPEYGKYISSVPLLFPNPLKMFKKTS